MFLNIYGLVTIKLDNLAPHQENFIREELGYFEQPDKEESPADITISGIDKLSKSPSLSYISTYAAFDGQTFYLLDDNGSFVTFPLEDVKNRVNIMCEKCFNEYSLLFALELFIRYKLILKDSVLIHASSVSVDEKGYLFTAWGGAGKSSLMLSFCKRGAKYSSDDLCIISKDGKLYPYPKRIHLLDYNFSAFPEFIDKIGQGFKRKWIMYKITKTFYDKGPRIPILYRLNGVIHRHYKRFVFRHVPFKKLFPYGDIASISEIHKVFFLVCSEAKEVRAEPYEPDEIASRMATCDSFDKDVVRDIPLLYRFAFPHHDQSFLQNLLSNEEKLLEDIFRGRKCLKVSVPRLAKPEDLYLAVSS